MTDYFAVMQEQRRPWLEPDILKQKFLAMSAEAHPDRSHAGSVEEKARTQAHFTELNAAYQCLHDPRQRMRHFLELEAGANPSQVQRVPGELMDLSLQIGDACRAADAVLTEKTSTTSPLLQLQIFQRAQAEMEKLAAIQRVLEARKEGLFAEVKSLDAAWNDARGADRAAQVRKLEELYPLLSYYERWTAQVRERVVQLSL